MDPADEATLEPVVREHWAPCYRLALAVTRDPAAAEDAAQEALIELVHEARDGRRPERVGPWLRGVTLNRARMLVRSSARRRGHEERVTAPRSRGPERDPLTELRELTAALPEDQRLPLELCYGLAWTHAEAAAALGVPTGTVASRIRLGLERLRKRLAAPVAGAALAALLGQALAGALGEAPAAPSVAGLLARPRPAPAPPVPLAGGKAAVLAAVLAAAGLASLAAPDGGAPGDRGAPPGAGAPREASGATAARQLAAGTTPPRRDAPAAAPLVASVGPSWSALAARPAPLAATRLPGEQRWAEGLSGAGLSPDRRHVVTVSPWQVSAWDLLARGPARRAEVRALAADLVAEDAPDVESSLVGFLDARSCVVELRRRDDPERREVLVLGVPGLEVVRRFGAAEAPGAGLAFTRGDGRTVTSLARGELWDALDGRRTPFALEHEVGSFALSADGSTLATLSGELDEPRRLCVWRWSSGWTPVARGELPPQDARVAMAFRPDGSGLLVEVDQRLLEVDPATARVLGEVALPGPISSSLPFLVGDDGVIVVADDTTCAIQVLRPGGEAGALHGHSSWVADSAAWPLGFLVDGSLATAGRDGTVRRFDVEREEELTPAGPASPIEAVALAPEGARAVSAQSHGDLWLWDLASGEGRPVTPYRGASAAEQTVVFVRGGERIVHVGREEHMPWPGAAWLQVLDASSGAVTRSSLVLVDGEPPAAIALSASGEALVAATAARALVLSVPDLRPLGASLPGADHVAISPDCAQAAGWTEATCTVRVHDVESGVERRALVLDESCVFGLEVRRDVVLVRAYGHVDAFDLETGARRWRCATGQDGRPSLALSVDGAVAAISRSCDPDGGSRSGALVAFVDVATGRELGAVRAEGPHRRLGALALSPDGRLVLGASRGSDGAFGALLRWDLP